MSYYFRKKAELREKAFDWQHGFGDHDYSWGEIAEFSDYFYTMGKRFGLLKEFRENVIC